MKKHYFIFILFLSTLLFLSLNLNAQIADIPKIGEVGAGAMPEKIAPYGDLPFAFPQLERPVFPDLTISITERGAKSSSLITNIVNNTIKEVYEKGGGTVVIPSGKWKSGRIVLKSNVNLNIAEGAEIEFSGNPEDYLPAVFTRHEGIEVMAPGAFIYANGENNIAVTGKGIIYGPPMEAEIRSRPNGASVVENDVPVDMPIEERLFDGMEGRHIYRPKTISPINCKNILIEGITMERCLLWNVVPTYCENVIIRGVTVNSTNVPSGDGIDIESSKNVLIEYCTLNCGDDCFTLKAGRAEDGLRVCKPTENVLIRYCLAKEGHGGITCGSETAGFIKNVYAYNCVFDGTRSGIRFKTRRNRGGGTFNTIFKNIRMINVGGAFTWDLLGSQQYMGELAERTPPRPINKLTPSITNIQISDFVVESHGRFFKVNGIPEIPLDNVIVKNGKIKCKQLITEMVDVAGFVMEDLEITSEENNINIDNGRNILLQNVKFIVPNNELVINVKGNNSENIIFRKITPDNKNIEYSGISPFIVKTK